MNVIFLDIDGVLNNEKSFLRMRDDGTYYLVRDYINKDLVELLNKLVEDTGAKIVVTSPIKHKGTNFLNRMLTNYGLTTHIYDVTPISDDKYNRGGEIKRWLSECKESIEGYVIFDDSPYLFENSDEVILNHIIFVDASTGLSEANVKQSKNGFYLK
jgi:hypothetical protein